MLPVDKTYNVVQNFSKMPKVCIYLAKSVSFLVSLEIIFGMVKFGMSESNPGWEVGLNPSTGVSQMKCSSMQKSSWNGNHLAIRIFMEQFFSFWNIFKLQPKQLALQMYFHISKCHSEMGLLWVNWVSVSNKRVQDTLQNTTYTWNSAEFSSSFKTSSLNTYRVLESTTFQIQDLVWIQVYPVLARVFSVFFKVSCIHVSQLYTVKFRVPHSSSN